MSWRVEFTLRAKKDIERLSTKDQRRILAFSPDEFRNIQIQKRSPNAWSERKKKHGGFVLAITGSSSSSKIAALSSLSWK